MATTTQTREIETHSPADQSRTDVVPLDRVTRAIRNDARDGAEDYADQVRVPFGGE